ncbi:hypothetical protein A6A04_00805 [Paramagnetospirillum marisnigri]|uniref:Uncharacterized protein n=1 Tax=Paramagnetospirillum marisnigri TaxID=1285242 RepID=A0A178MS17_9PROT|nr:hypothetical protein [Paramagnetospirillum marisnigri]OAN52265.1 hypothetical protein A6A04_00805 [Paramagnetospirillum marisnigri]
MAAIGDTITLDDHQQAAFDGMCSIIDTVEDGIELLTRTQDLVNILLRRASDQDLRDHTLGEVSRFFLGIIKASDLSPEYRIRRLRQFAKATLHLLLSKRPHQPRPEHPPPPS